MAAHRTGHGTRQHQGEQDGCDEHHRDQRHRNFRWTIADTTNVRAAPLTSFAAREGAHVPRRSPYRPGQADTQQRPSPARDLLLVAACSRRGELPVLAVLHRPGDEARERAVKVDPSPETLVERARATAARVDTDRGQSQIRSSRPSSPCPLDNPSPGEGRSDDTMTADQALNHVRPTADEPHPARRACRASAPFLLQPCLKVAGGMDRRRSEFGKRVPPACQVA